MSSERSFRFSHAIVRHPGASVVRGLRARDAGDPDLAAFREEHRAYVAALRSAGLDVSELPAAEPFPDSVFIEDAALCLGDTAILMRPGEASRAGEPEHLRPALEARFENVLELPHRDGIRIEAGDTLTTEREVLVGLSRRTSRAGFEALAEALGELGHRARQVDTPPGVLHLKTDCAVVDAETIFATRRLAASRCFAGYRVIETPPGEEAAANLVRVNDHVLLASGYPRTADLLAGIGDALVPLPVVEAAKLDGGLSCLSLRYARRG